VNVAPTESINEIVNKRLTAVKRLQDNPNDSEAMATLHYAEIQVNQSNNQSSHERVADEPVGAGEEPARPVHGSHGRTVSLRARARTLRQTRAGVGAQGAARTAEIIAIALIFRIN